MPRADQLRQGGGYSITLFYGSSCPNNGKDALNTPGGKGGGCIPISRWSSSANQRHAGTELDQSGGGIRHLTCTSRSPAKLRM
eukprot:8885473-Pyramimonas_sp.AAC.1